VTITKDVAASNEAVVNYWYVAPETRIFLA